MEGSGASATSRNPAVKRVLQEIRELQREQSKEFAAEALESNLFEWIFAIRGPLGSPFEGGIYVGRIMLPHNYPMAPPSFMFMTANGRFERGAKICLSISQHHPEEWQPSWGVRTALTALVPFLATPGNGALGSLDMPDDDRRALAAQSRLAPPNMGSPEGQTVASRLHRYMLETEDDYIRQHTGVPQPAPSDAAQGGAATGQVLASASDRRTAAAEAAERRLRHAAAHETEAQPEGAPTQGEGAQEARQVDGPHSDSPASSAAAAGVSPRNSLSRKLFRPRTEGPRDPLGGPGSSWPGRSEGAAVVTGGAAETAADVARDVPEAGASHVRASHGTVSAGTGPVFESQTETREAAWRPAQDAARRRVAGRSIDVTGADAGAQGDVPDLTGARPGEEGNGADGDGAGPLQPEGGRRNMQAGAGQIIQTNAYGAMIRQALLLGAHAALPATAAC